MTTMSQKISLSISQALFTFFLLILFFTVLNGYALNLIFKSANPWLVLIGIIVEIIILLILGQRFLAIENDAFELGSFLLVIMGVWLYFIAPSLPTLLPPTQSSDAVRVYLQMLFTVPEGKLVNWYPAGGTFVAAMFSNWLGIAPLRILHPIAASFIALTAGAIYGIACSLLREQRWGKIAALFAPALLFAPWSYFVGIINWEQFFFAQAFSQLFVVAAMWYTANYAQQPHWIFASLIGASLVGAVTAYPIFVALPFALFALVVLGQAIRARNKSALVVLGIFAALMVGIAIALQLSGILELQSAKVSATSNVGEGGVANPSLETLGGLVFLFLALIGAPLAWRNGTWGKTILALVAAWGLQYLAMMISQPFLQLSGYRVDKTFYVLIFPLALLATLPLAWAFTQISSRLQTLRANTAFASTSIIVIILVIVLRPPVFFSPFTESELQVASWAKQNLDTYQINFIDSSNLRSYWLAMGLWHETLPNEWFQWMPAGVKLGPPTFAEWLTDSDWPRWLFVRDVNTQAISPARVIYQNGTSAIIEKATQPLDAPTPTHISRRYFNTAIKLLGYDLPRTTFKPGETITTTTFVESIYPPPQTVGWRFELVDQTQHIVTTIAADPFANKFPLQRWSPGRYAQDKWVIVIDPSLPPGMYDLQLGLFRRQDGKELSAWFTDPITGAVLTNKKPPESAVLTSIKILAPSPSAAELRAATTLEARIGDSFMLSRYTLQFDSAARTAHLTLYWQDIVKTDKSYTAFVHILDSSNQVVAQKDAEPFDGNYPTSIWDAQEIIKEQYALSIPADARGPFSIEIGMYSKPDFKRLPVGNEDRILLRDIIK